MTQKEFDKALENSKIEAEAIVSALSVAAPNDMEPLVRRFIACKYFLTPEEMTTDQLLPLGEYSTAKLIGLRNKGLQFAEKNSGCTSASSGVIKKVLLVMALGRIFGITLDPDKVSMVDTIPQLVKLLNDYIN